jgi:CubicO group peptidase (beta-lactamase class C family)
MPEAQVKLAIDAGDGERSLALAVGWISSASRNRSRKDKDNERSHQGGTDALSAWFPLATMADGDTSMNRRALLSAAASTLATASVPNALAQTSRPFANALRISAERGGVALIIARHGVVLAEAYQGGRHDQRWPIGAGTRMFAGLLAATLAQERLLTLDEPVALTLGDWGAHPVKSTISIRALLSGASGLAFDRGDARDLATALALEPRAAPGVRFSDDEAPYLLMEEIARRKLLAEGRDGDAALYLTSYALAAIGCIPIGWTRAASGAARFDDGVSLTARAWAAAGELIRREGIWRAQQLADDQTLREAVRGSFAESRAGFGFWIAGGSARGELGVDTDLWRARSPAPADLAMAAGEGGQRLYIVPSQGLVIARQSRSAREAWSDAQFLTQVWTDL